MTYPGQGQSATANVVLNANVAGYNQSMAAATAHTGLLSKALGEVEKHLTGLSGKAAHKLTGFAKSEFAYLGVATTLAATFQKQLGTLAGQSAVTGTSMKAVKGSIESSFNKFPVARKDVIALTETLTQLGVKGNANLSSLTKTFIKLGAATGESPQALASGLVQLSRLMGTTNATQVGNYANALLTVSAKAGVSTTSVLDFAQAIAPLARQAGIGTTAVLGISTAFSKAGADGFVAANAFNSIISQITSLQATGSPELAKFTNLIGVTTDQFAKMDKTTAFTDIIDAITKGGPGAIDTLNRLGFEGVRTLSSLQSVAQAGDIKTQVANALGASGDQGNLNKGAKAAFGGLADQSIQLKNTITQAGTSVGTTFLAPLTKVLHIVNAIMGGFNALAPIKAVVGALAGAFALLAAAILLAAAASSKLLLGAFLLRSGPVGALRQGLRVPVGTAATGSATRVWNRPGFVAGQAIRGRWDAGRGVLATRAASREAGLLARDQAIAAIRPGGLLVGGRTPEQAAERRAALSGGLTMPARIRGAILGPRGVGALSLINTQRQFVQTAGTRGENRLPGMMPQTSYQARRFGAFLTGGTAPERPVPGEYRQASLARLGGWRVQQLAARVTGRDAPERPAQRLAPMGGGAVTRIISAGSTENKAYNAAIKETIAATNRLTMAETALAKADQSGIVADHEAAAAAKARAMADHEAAIATQESRLKEAEAANAAAFAQKGLGAQARSLTVALARLQGATVLAAGKTLGAGVAGLAGGAMNIVKGLGLVGTAMLAIPATLAIVHAVQGKAKAYNAEVGANLNPITKYDDQLGIATTSLATFSAAAATATDKLNGITSGSSMDQATHVSDSDVTNAQGQKVTDKVIIAAYKASKHDPASEQLTIANLLPSYNLQKPEEAQLVKSNLLSIGFGRGAVQGAMTGNIPNAILGGTQPMNFGTLPGIVADSQGKGTFVQNPSKSVGAPTSDQEATRIGLAYTGNVPQFGAAFAGQKRLQDIAGFAAQSLHAAPNLDSTKGGLNAEQLAGEFSVMFGGDKKKYLSAFKDIMAPPPSAVTPVAGAGGGPPGGGGGGGVYVPPGADGKPINVYAPGGGTTAGAKAPAAPPPLTYGQIEQRVIDKVIPATQEGRNALAGLKTISGTTTNIADMPGALAKLLAAGPGASADQITLRGAGPLGKVVAGDTTVLAAKALPGDASLQFAAGRSMLADAQSLGGGPEGVDKNLSDFMLGIKDVNSQFYLTAQAARTLNDALLTASMAAMNRAPQFAAVADKYVGTAQAAAKGDPDAQKALPAATTDYNQAKLAQDQFKVQAYQELLASQVQSGRAEDAYNLQRGNATRDFNTQQLYALKDHQLQVTRSTEDFHRQMAREAQAAAETIYNPFERVQAKYTTDTGTLLQNLADQNEQIIKQKSQLTMLKKKGLSQNAIDTLQLANPDNAQQVNNMSTNQITPGQISAINSQVKTRVKATTSLTQSTFSESWRNTLADFNRELSHGAIDFATQTDRAIAAQALQLSDMAKAFGVQSRNAAQDLAVSMKGLLANFGAQTGEAAKGLSGMLGLLPADLAKDYIAAIDTIGAEVIAVNIAIAAAAARAAAAGTHNTDHNTYNYGPGGPPKAPAGTKGDNITLPPGTSVTVGAAGQRGHALGGISTREHYAHFSEGNKAETIIPLDDRGLRFMTGFVTQVSMAMVRQMATAQHPMAPSGPAGASTVTYHVDQGTDFSGPVTVQASDPDAMGRALKAKARLERLSSPVRHS